jgi:hypothetical protein
MTQEVHARVKIDELPAAADRHVCNRGAANTQAAMVVDLREFLVAEGHGEVRCLRRFDTGLDAKPDCLGASARLQASA